MRYRPRPFEQWRPVEGFESLYLVSDLGRVWSLRRHRPMTFTPDKNGYSQVTFHDLEGRPFTRKAHRLVAAAFIPNPRGLPEVDHRFGVVDDNRVTELRWTSRSHNRFNRHAPSASASGVVGVCYRAEKKNPWQAYCGFKAGFKSLGHFPTKAQATAARKEFERQYR